MRSSALLAALALLAACLLSACGSSGPSAEDEARETAVGAIETTNAKTFCRQLVSDQLIEEVVIGGSVAACEKASVVADDPGTATASTVSLRGEDESVAEVAVRVEGGELDGVAGHLELVREGDRWLLDRYGEDFLRSSFLVAIETVEEGAISNSRMKACIGKQAAELSGTRLREINRAATSDPAALVKALLPLAEKCPAALAEYAADEFTEGLAEKGKSPAYVRCLHDELEAFLELTDIVPELLGENPGFAAVAALEGIAAGAKRNCAGSSG